MTKEQVHELRSSLGSLGMAWDIVAPAIPKEKNNFAQIIERQLANCMDILNGVKK